MNPITALVALPATSRPRSGRLGLLSLALSSLLAACGGGGGDPGISPFPAPEDTSSPPVVTPADSSAQVCAAENPYLADATAATRIGSLANEKAWLKAYMSEAYLWVNEIQNIDPYLPAYSQTSDVYGSMDSYFQALKTPSLTATGKRLDAFSFTYPTRAWNDLSSSGTVSGYGAEWHMASPTPPRELRIAYIEPGSPAAAAGLLRGDVLVSADGAAADSATSADVDTLNAALFPSATGQSHSFVFSRQGSSLTRSLVSASVVKQPVLTQRVLHTPAGRSVGYMVFNDHIAPAEAPLIAAIHQFAAARVDDLVLDLRYNGGGYLFLASELAYMVAGPARTDGQVFEQLRFNAQRVADNQSADARTPFLSTSCILDASGLCTQQAALPTLNLSRVTVLTSSGTCSASEAIINGLRGVNVEVRLIGDTTCGKPYGFTPKDNCGISYFPIEFKGVNAKGFGDYADGFSPTCTAADDLDHALGDPAEHQLAVALNNLDGASCSATAAGQRQAQGLVPRSGGRLLRGPERENRILLPRRH